MLDAILVLFAFFGATWTIKESDLLSRPRQWLMSHSVWLARLLFCWFCTGFWAGPLVYGLWLCPWLHFALWGLAGATISLFGNAVLTKLTWTKINS